MMKTRRRKKAVFTVVAKCTSILVDCPQCGNRIEIDASTLFEDVIAGTATVVCQECGNEIRRDAKKDGLVASVQLRDIDD